MPQNSEASSSCEDLILGFFVVGLLIALIFGLLGEIVIAYVVLIIIILIAVVNLAFAMKSPATPIYTPSNIDIRRQFVQRDESKWLKLGVIGYGSTSAFNEIDARQILKTLYRDIATNSNKNLIVVSGWLASGISLLAYEEAKAVGIPTIGFAPKEARQFDTFNCDEVHLVGNQWGEETKAFLSFIDGLIQIGGSISDHQLYKEFKGPKWRFMLNGETPDGYVQTTAAPTTNTTSVDNSSHVE